ncbi:MAG: methylated-DNA--[protein]-cysteine S-methyltransferase [Nitrospinota bacterium]
MEPIIYHAEIPTSTGTLQIAATDRGACALVLPEVEEPKARVARLLSRARPGPADHPILLALLNAGSRYFNGEPEAFEGLPVDWSFVTAFQKRVYAVARTIPSGEVRSYGWVATHMGRPGAARAVGQALAANPVPLVVPCHRVVATDGSLGGYSAGIPFKRKLLALEGAEGALFFEKNASNPLTIS